MVRCEDGIEACGSTIEPPCSTSSFKPELCHAVHFNNLAFNQTSSTPGLTDGTLLSTTSDLVGTHDFVLATPAECTGGCIVHVIFVTNPSSPPTLVTFSNTNVQSICSLVAMGEWSCSANQLLKTVRITSLYTMRIREMYIYKNGDLTRLLRYH